MSEQPIQGKVPRRRVVDGRIHFVQNLAKNPESGVFLYRFSHLGRVHAGSTGCYKLTDARAYLNGLRGRFNLEGIGVRRPKAVTFRQCYEAWIKERAPQRSKGCVDTLTCSMVKHVLPILGTLQIDEIETTHISMVLNKYLKTFSASGANSVGRHIGALLGFAVESKWIKGHENALSHKSFGPDSEFGESPQSRGSHSTPEGQQRAIQKSA